MGSPGGSAVKNLPVIQETSGNAGDIDSFPGSGRSPGEGNGNPLQYSCLGNPMDRELGGLQPMWLQELDTTYGLAFLNCVIIFGFGSFFVSICLCRKNTLLG